MYFTFDVFKLHSSNHELTQLGEDIIANVVQ